MAATLAVGQQGDQPLVLLRALDVSLGRRHHAWRGARHVRLPCPALLRRLHVAWFVVYRQARLAQLRLQPRDVSAGILHICGHIERGMQAERALLLQQMMQALATNRQLLLQLVDVIVGHWAVLPAWAVCLGGTPVSIAQL